MVWWFLHKTTSTYSKSLFAKVGITKMRITIKRRNSTKSERIFYEILKELRIPFKYKVVIDGREIDFLVDEYAVEIDGHEQSTEKNVRLYELGFVPLHYDNKELKFERNKIKKTWKNYGRNKIKK